MNQLFVLGLTSVLFGFVGQACFGQTIALQQPTTLHATMRQMSDDLKTITAQASDSSKNQASAQIALDFVAMTLHSKDFIPDEVAQLPQDQQATELEAYKSLLDKVAEEGRQMAAAFQNNQNAAVASILLQMKQDKEQGHDRFR